MGRVYVELWEGFNVQLWVGSVYNYGRVYVALWAVDYVVLWAGLYSIIGGVYVIVIPWF